MHGTFPPGRKRIRRIDPPATVGPSETPRRRATRRHSSIVAALHGTTLLALVLMIAAGWSLHFVETTPRSVARALLTTFHALMGLTVLVLGLSRPLLWLIYRPLPVPKAGDWVARIVGGGFRAVFFVLLLALPITGWLAFDMADQSLPFAGIASRFDLITWDASTRHLVFAGIWLPIEVPDQSKLAGAIARLHGGLAGMMAVLLVLHLSALASQRWRRT